VYFHKLKKNVLQVGYLTSKPSGYLNVNLWTKF